MSMSIESLNFEGIGSRPDPFPKVSRPTDSCTSVKKSMNPATANVGRPGAMRTQQVAGLYVIRYTCTAEPSLGPRLPLAVYVCCYRYPDT